MKRQSPSTLFTLLFLTTAGAAAGCGGGTSPSARMPGQTTFDTEDPANGARGANFGGGPTGAQGGAPTDSKTAGPTAPPSGRTAMVEEADIYRIDHNRLFYLNTYKGFLIYDITNPKAPQRLSRLPVYGYPVEMFVSGTTVYALLSDVLYVTEQQGAARFERRHVSELVSIDISDPANPRVLKTIDIVGQLREGVSRKIDNTLYVVSSVPQGYYWGWRYELPSNPQQEQAWVYSFNVADPTNLALVDQLKIFEGGSVTDVDPITGGGVTRYFTGVTIGATSNALMVVENWSLSSWTPGTDNAKNGTYTCGTYAGDQRAIVSLVDVSDPTGAIHLHTRFQTRGALGDQFKHTYVYDAATNQGTYFGIFARQSWVSTDCSGQSFIQNALESWDVTNGAAPARLAQLDFGKADETVRGSAFDVDRKVAYAVTAKSIDPLYVLDISNRGHLAIRSSIDGLSGDMTLFRLVEGNKFLVGIGNDTSTTCSGFQGTEARHGVGIAVSLIDVQNLDAIRLVQRQCVAVDGEWASSEVTWNLDQAHKLIGMQSDGTTNVITVPVSYSKRIQGQGQYDWWWYTWQTAVGIMSWDLTKYDPTKPATAQTVIQNYGTFLHPNGEVRRSIVFAHEATGRRTMINLSDTHISVADIQDLANPVQQSIVEIAPYNGQVYQFGGYAVEQVETSPTYYWGAPDQGLTEFRVKRAGGDLETTPVVSRFSVAQVQSVIPHGNQLVVFRIEQDPSTGTGTTHVMVFDLTDPTQPRLAGQTQMAGYFYAYYPYRCGVGAYWYWYGPSTWVSTTDALAVLGYTWDPATSTSGAKVSFLDLRDPTQPSVSEVPIPTRANGYFTGLAADDADPSGFFLTFRDYLAQTQNGTTVFQRSRYYAQRWHRSGDAWRGDEPVNLPGQLARTWQHASGKRAYLTSDYVNYQTADTSGNVYWAMDTRLNLLRATSTVGGAPAAELMASHRFAGEYVSDIIQDGASLFVNASPGYGYGYYGGGVATGVGGPTTAVSKTAGGLTADDVSDRLEIFDLRAFALDAVYAKPTGTQGVQLMGTYHGQLFMNVMGDGVLAVDVTDPAHPTGRQFLQTLGWATHLAFIGDHAYIASGNYGVYHMDLTAAPNLPLTN